MNSLTEVFFAPKESERLRVVEKIDTDRLRDLEDLLCDESGKEVISLDELREIVQAQVTGCDLCHGEEAEHGFSIEDNELYYADTMNGNEGIKINYCPRCGRILPKRPAISVLMDASICSGCVHRGEEICGSCVRNGRGNDVDFYSKEKEK